MSKPTELPRRFPRDGARLNQWELQVLMDLAWRIKNSKLRLSRDIRDNADSAASLLDKKRETFRPTS